jgi:hypothetical protein
MTSYLLKGNRPGFNFDGLALADCPDGYTEFRRKDGTVQAVVMTSLLCEASDGN